MLDSDVERARATAREYAQLYLGASNYTNNLLKLGFSAGGHRRRRLRPA